MAIGLGATATHCLFWMTDTHLVYLGLGSNLGDREGYLREAIQKIERLIGTVVRQSALYRSEPWGFQSDNTFVNSVICVQRTSLSDFICCNRQVKIIFPACGCNFVNSDNFR